MSESKGGLISFAHIGLIAGFAFSGSHAPAWERGNGDVKC